MGLLCVASVSPLYSRNPKTSTFANSEDPYKVQHNAAFHQGLHCKGKIKSSDKRIQHILKIIT